MLRVRSSRRAAGLKPSDYDHEIDLENHDESRPQSSVPTTHRPSTTSPLLSTDAARQQRDALPEEAATPQLQDVPSGVTPTWRSNAYHKASPTSIHTAQVPDPSWEWTWPEWRINHQEGVDEGGWEYSFAFSNKFSWHAAKWWNSFVRRRAWTRKRAQRRQNGDASGPNMLNTNYFTVRPASHTRRLSCGSIGGAGVPSRSSMSQLSVAAASEADGDEEAAERRPDIEDMDTLLTTLRLARIDREKGEAVDNYIEHAGDLEALQGEMHEIMSLFVFQASRRQLLGRLMRRHDDAAAELEGRPSDEALRERKLALDAAVYHASEEVRRLAFWSDVRQMARDGESRLSIELGEKGGRVEGIKMKIEKGEEEHLEREREKDEEKRREGAGDEQVGRGSVEC
ncbi:hypothetical protein CDD80_2709 [Ophiocordyceps camponoti-rufipedis]|uniref:Peroxin/Ferlin domain-containing protein n=1 Tax=Ophiocordyceps camponoti-rufipedis TaxID=2004952 RepID=A0A2C5Z6L7_9HYPO|nr:hypothetical protein CDD80_2709 [Ophiocordyceps camponoti-rufipedis]